MSRKKTQRVVITKYGVIRELNRTRKWYWEFDLKDLRFGLCWNDTSIEFNLPGFAVWCDRYWQHGETLSGVPEGAEVVVDRRSYKVWR